MRAAIIGTGFAAEIHARSLTELGHQLAVVVHPQQEKAEAFARQHNAAAAATDPCLAFSLPVDAVHICTPPASHYGLAKDALTAGMHVFCEKPLCLEPARAAELYHLARSRQRIAAVNFNVRFHEACHQAQSVIISTAFGDPCLLHGRYLQEFHALPAAYSWRYQPEQAGCMRAVTEIGSHWFDLARYLTGLEVSAVSAHFARFSPERRLENGTMYLPDAHHTANLPVDSEDAAVISLQFSNGAMGSLVVSETAHGRINQLQIEVDSRTHSVWWDSEEPYRLHQAGKSTGVTTCTFPFGGGFAGTFRDSIAAFYQAIQKGSQQSTPAYPSFYDGAVNAAICAAAYQSATNGGQWTAVEDIAGEAKP
ncbi:MAG: Gfo/Idh/MocA family oxidoreductase [Anaerolineae bacterium]|nr:Gfo/Idh/MocA family oxidoreductase [Anaerolineae bacterium]